MHDRNTFKNLYRKPSYITSVKTAAGNTHTGGGCPAETPSDCQGGPSCTFCDECVHPGEAARLRECQPLLCHAWLMQASVVSGADALISYQASDRLQSISRRKSLVKAPENTPCLLCLQIIHRSPTFLRWKRRYTLLNLQLSCKYYLAPKEEGFLFFFFLFRFL